MIETTYLSICWEKKKKRRELSESNGNADNKRTNNINATAKYQAARQIANMNANRWNKWERTVEPIFVENMKKTQNRAHILNIPGNVFVMVSRLQLPLPFCHVTHILHIFICRFSSSLCCCCHSRQFFFFLLSFFDFCFGYLFAFNLRLREENVRCWEIALCFINSSRKSQFKTVYYYEWLALDCFNLSIWCGISLAIHFKHTFVDVELNVLDIKLKLTISNVLCLIDFNIIDLIDDWWRMINNSSRNVTHTRYAKSSPLIPVDCVYEFDGVALTLANAFVFIVCIT